MEPKDKIYELRKKIDECDDKMLDLLVKRFSIAMKIGEIKASSGFNIEDQNREKNIIDRLTNKFEGKLDRNSIAAIFRPVYQISKKLQKK